MLRAMKLAIQANWRSLNGGLSLDCLSDGCSGVVISFAILSKVTVLVVCLIEIILKATKHAPF